MMRAQSSLMLPRTAACLWCALVPALPLAGQSAFPPDSAIRSIMAARIGKGGAAGVVIGLLEPDGSTRVLAAGDGGAGRSLDAESVFEIGSITKVFTGAVLADMVTRGEVTLSDPLSTHLPDTVRVPSRNGIAITLEHLATQRSGLPRLPSNLRMTNALNPYSEYTVDRLYAFLNGHTLVRDPGEAYEYSNLAVGLLGHVLARRAGKSYEALVRERVLEPLGMTHTAVTLTPWLAAHMVAGHNALGDTVPLWDLAALAGAGALRSNASDMLRFAEAALRGRGPAPEALRLAMQPRATAGTMTIGLLWHRLATAAGDTIVWHNGGTGGFRTFVGVVPASGRGLVLLSNSGGTGLDDVAFHLLDPALPLARR
jgi:CubicO group peptidase (beta-lactamase class C family)